MTDNEIIKALEEYRNSKIVQSDNGVISIGNILDLITRQKEQIESLISGQETLQKALNEKIAEVESLKHSLKETQNEAKYFFTERQSLNKQIVKEFAERLKAKSSCCVASQNGQELYETKRYTIKAIEIDKLVKEMVGDAE